MSASGSKRVVWGAYVLGGLTACIALWAWQGLTSPRTAWAQVPDSGRQRNEMIEELRTSNKKLTEIAGYLREMRDAQKKSDKKLADQPSEPRRPTDQPSEPKKPDAAP